jgi:hypothetical protein
VVLDRCSDQDALPGISAVVLAAADDLAPVVLDLAAVLQGLVDHRFEIILVTRDSRPASLPGVPVRVLQGVTLAEACDLARFDLLLLTARDGQFDLRELNHLFDAIQAGADVAAGYRPRRRDALVRQFQRFGWNLDVDCAFQLVRRAAWRDLEQRHGRLPAWPSCSELLSRLRGLSYRLTELPVSHRRPTLGAPTSATPRAA